MKIIQTLFFLCLFNLCLVAQEAYYCPPCGLVCDLVEFEEPGTCNQCPMQLVKRTKNEQMAAIQKRAEGRTTILFYLHEGIEILDWAGPAEAFTVSGFDVITASVDGKPITSQGVFKIEPMYSIENCPKTDIIAFFGGNANAASNNPKVISWLKKRAEETDIVFSVCTGAFFLAKAGLLDGQVATTFHESISSLQKLAPKAVIKRNVKYVDNGKIVTAAGVSSGIHGALHLVQRLKGKERAQATARYMEYEDWKGNEGLVVNQK